MVSSTSELELTRKKTYDDSPLEIRRNASITQHVNTYKMIVYNIVSDYLSTIAGL